MLSSFTPLLKVLFFFFHFQPDFSNTSSELDSPSHHDISLISGNHSLFEGGVGLVRHDRLLTDCQDLISSTGLPMTTVKSEVQEHSYSSVVGSDGDSIPDSPLSCTNETGENSKITFSCPKSIIFNSYRVGLPFRSNEHFHQGRTYGLFLHVERAFLQWHRKLERRAFRDNYNNKHSFYQYSAEKCTHSTLNVSQSQFES